MIAIYAILIEKGLKTLDQVPQTIREEVRLFIEAKEKEKENSGGDL